MSIPASNIVSIVPGVVSAGASELSLNGVILTKNTDIPVGSVIGFTSSDAVSAYLGAASAEYAIAPYYFGGFNNATAIPGTLFFSHYADVNRAAYLRGGTFTASIATLQTYTGTLTIMVDGTSITSSTINLATATSYSSAATLISAGFTGGKPVVTWNSNLQAFVATSTTTGATSTITFASGTLAANLKLTSATGAILSQGCVADTPATAMARVVAATQNWVSFTTMWEPVTADKTAFAVWANGKNQRYLYVAYDSDGQATVQGSTTCFGVLAKTAAYDAVACLYSGIDKAVFTMGAIAAIDFTRTNGRATMAFKSQSGLTADVTDETVAATLLANGYSFYGTYATANDTFTWLYNGQISGKWKWIDTYVNQVWFNSELQLALMTLLAAIKSIPYNQAGYDQIRAAMMDPITAMKNFGGIRAGISLSNSQKAQINSAAGADIDSTLTSQGYYLQILDPGATVRANRGTPVINLWYTDGGAVQKISVASIDVM
jgi:hypothetical protein